jgi:diaminohydroxyphosphoribosylaminopyrimidine deaminase/5-amino-6-(5-phosphoribosylamino)uracil reductase
VAAPTDINPPTEAHPLSPLDALRLREALDLAEGVIGLTDPNPRVGCVLGTQDGRVLGRGATQEVGGPHAEVMALREAAANGHDVRGATAWVTLEPCAHHGRTPPCCDALIAAGIGRVVAAMQDPFPAVAGQGMARLRAAGVQVALAGGALAEAAREINIGFFSRVLRGRPWIRLKTACSLDGRTALPNGVSQWITGPAARADGHAWRRRASVVLTGIGTILSDDPGLDVRLVPTRKQPRRAVLDSRLRIPVDAAILQRPGTLVYTSSNDAERQMALSAIGAEVIRLTTDRERVDLHALTTDLTVRQANEVHVEAGAALTGSWLESDAADELLMYVAPMVLGPGRGIADLLPSQDLATTRRFQFAGSEFVGQDLRLILRRIDSLPEHWCPLPP